MPSTTIDDLLSNLMAYREELEHLYTMESTLSDRWDEIEVHITLLNQQCNTVQSDEDEYVLLSQVRQKLIRKAKLNTALAEVIDRIDYVYDGMLNIELQLREISAQLLRLSDEDIEQIPRMQITKQQADDIASCSVCLMEYKEGEAVCKLPCSHLYHVDCITQWLQANRNCPYCRADVGQ